MAFLLYTPSLQWDLSLLVDAKSNLLEAEGF